MHPAKTGVFYQNGGTFPKRDSDYDTIRVSFILPILCVVCYNHPNSSVFDALIKQ